MSAFQKAAHAKEAKAEETVKNLLVGAGVVAALLWLLQAAAKK